MSLIKIGNLYVAETTVTNINVDWANMTFYIYVKDLKEPHESIFHDRGMFNMAMTLLDEQIGIKNTNYSG